MADLFRNRTTSGTGTGVSFTGPATVIFPADCVFGGAQVDVEIAVADTDSDYKPVRRGFFHGDAEPEVVGGTGTYYLRAVCYNASATTDITVEAIQ